MELRLKKQKITLPVFTSCTYTKIEIGEYCLA